MMKIFSLFYKQSATLYIYTHTHYNQSSILFTYPKLFSQKKKKNFKIIPLVLLNKYQS